jgi:hypothetical protein
METKIVLDNLQKYSNDLEKQYPNESTYWHLQKLRNEIERVKDIVCRDQENEEWLFVNGEYVTDCKIYTDKQ